MGIVAAVSVINTSGSSSEVSIRESRTVMPHLRGSTTLPWYRVSSVSVVNEHLGAIGAREVSFLLNPAPSGWAASYVR